MLEFISAPEAAKKWGISSCKQGFPQFHKHSQLYDIPTMPAPTESISLSISLLEISFYRPIGFVMLKYYTPPHGFEEDATFTDGKALFEALWQEWLDMKLYLIAKGTPLLFYSSCFGKTHFTNNSLP